MENPSQGEVLIVDDAPQNLRAVTLLLEHLRYRVKPVTSGSEAIEAVTSRPPDIIIMDVEMPGMSGFDVCRRIKSVESNSDIPVVFLSGRNSAEEKLQAFKSGGVDYVTKPFEVEELLARLDIHLTIRRLHKKLEVQNEKLSENCDRLKCAEQMRDGLTHMVMHDLRSPLSVICSVLDYINLHGEELPSIMREQAELGSQQARIMNNMIGDILDIGRLEDGHMPIRIGDSNLSDIVSQSISNVAVNGCRVVTEFEEGVESVRCDKDLIRRVTTNLLGNAIKFSPSSGEIRIAAEKGHHATRILVSDCGPGIPEKYHGKIFEKFCRLDRKERREIPSTGLGLAFCRLAVEAHGGHIGVKSARGEGGTFWFDLPEY